MRYAMNFVKTKYKNKLLVGAEIGVCEGIHAEQILKGLNIKTLYLIDVWGEYCQEKGQVYSFAYLYPIVIKKFKNNKKVIIWKKSSTVASKLIDNESLDFVYIDACHTYKSLKEDINVWFPKLKKGGVLSGHDYTPKWKGVVKAVDEFIKQTGYKLNTAIEAETDWWIVK